MKIKSLGHSDLVFNNNVKQITELKSDIGKHFGWKVDYFRLIYSGKGIDSNKDLKLAVYLHTIVEAKRDGISIYAVLMPEKIPIHEKACFTWKDNTISVSARWQVCQVKRYLYDSGYLEVPPTLQRMVIAGRVVKDFELMAEYCALNGSACTNVMVLGERVVKKQMLFEKPKGTPPSAGLERQPSTDHCYTCNRKLRAFIKIAGYCHCQRTFCPLHLSEHECHFDHRKLQRDSLEAKIPSKLSPKVAQI